MSSIKKWFFYSLTVYFTVAAMIKLFGLELNDLSCFFELFLLPYKITIELPFELAKDALGSININMPYYVRDILVVWIGLGRIVRRAISDISAELDEKSKKYNPRPEQSLSKKISIFTRKPIESIVGWFKKPVVKEGITATIFWPYRLCIDLKGDHATHREHVDGQKNPIDVKKFELTIYWKLSPKKVLIYLVTSFFVLGVLLLLNSHITIACTRTQ